MANTTTLTGLIPDLYEAMDIVARELTGMIPSVTLNASSARAAVSQAIRSYVAPAAAAETASPDRLPPDTGAQTIGTNSLVITASRVVPFQWTGEEELQVGAAHGRRSIQRDQVAQAIRTLVNEIEANLWKTAKEGASRCVGTIGNEVFKYVLGLGLGDAALVRRVLVDNGCPMTDLSLVIGSYEGLNLRQQATLPALGGDPGAMQLRDQGILIPLSGMAVRESYAVGAPVVGTTSATVNTAAYAVGATEFTLSAAACALVKGDIISFAGDTVTKYTITGGTLANAGTLQIGAPGLRTAISGSASPAITIITAANRNIALHRSAIQLALRAPAVPEEGDSADDRTVLTDPRTGISLEFAMYKQYRRVRYEVGAAFGSAVMKSDFIAQLYGKTG